MLAAAKISVVPALKESTTVLVVDDDALIRQLLERLLEQTWVNVLSARDAAEALRMIEANRVHVVISDYTMPGMSGVELLRTVKERWPLIQRVMLTGQVDAARLEQAVNESQISRFISKPWNDTAVLLTIQSAINEYWISAENERLRLLLAERNAALEGVNQSLESKVEERSKALRRAAEQWRACFDAIGDPLAIVTLGCDVLRANTAFARLAEREPRHLAGMHCDGGVYGALPCPVHALQNGLGQNGEVEATLGARSWRMRIFPFGEQSFVVTYKDVTEEQVVTRRMLQTEKMAAVGQLAGGVAHEINNPLGGILAFSQIMRSDPGRSAEDAESLRLIHEAALRAKKIVDSLLRFSRRPQDHELAEVARIDLAAVAEDALFLLAPHFKTGRAELRRELAPATVMGNANQLAQIVVNLVTNALQALGDDGGAITVSTGMGGDGRAHLAVADNGPGIPRKIVDRIFEPFFTTKPEGKGTGLGLAICYRIAEQHGGAVRVLSFTEGPARGTTFTLELPAAPEKQP